MKKPKRFHKRKLFQQLLGGFALSLIVISIATLSITSASLRHNLEEQIQQRAESITYGLEFASEGLIEIKEMLLLERIVQNYATLPAVIEVSIVDPQGILLAHSNEFALNAIEDRHYAKLHPTLALTWQQVSEQGIDKNIHTVLQGKTVVVQMLPFSSTLFNQVGVGSPADRKHRGVAIAVMDLQKMEQDALQSALSSILTMAVSALLILVFMSWLIRRLVLSPLDKINLAIIQSEGQDVFSLPTLPNNEISFLGATFAAVFQELKAYKQMELEIVERKYAQVAQRYELATRAAKVWVWDLDLKTNIFILDRGIQEWLSYENDEFSNNFHLKTWVNYIYIDDRPLFLQALQAHLEEKTSEFSCEHRLLKADGTTHWFLSRGQVVKNKHGTSVRAIGTITDIADRKQYEVELQTTNEELTRATRLKDEFLASMSHELRTPLNAILGMTEGLQENVFGVVNERQIQALQTIERSSSHLLSLINDILDVAKIEAGQILLDCTSISVAHLCQSSLDFVKSQAFKKKIQLNLLLPPDLREMFLDERRIRQVLINLLTNAVKFTLTGGQVSLKVYYEQIEINLAEQILLTKPQQMSQLYSNLESCPLENRYYLCISVIDTGIGIASNDQSKIFHPFVQVDSNLNRQYEGTGLGLTLVRQIVELHGGDISLHSQMGKGSCFTVRLPYLCRTKNQPNLTLSLSPDPVLSLEEIAISKIFPQPVVVEQPLILLAEDNEANISTVSSYLGAKGYRILQAKNGQEAIDLAINQQPDLILMDIQMPGMDGIEAMQQIRRNPNLVDVPIVALTALAMTGDRDRCLEAGANDYITKPVKLKQLATTIQQLLGKST
ncbi:MAG: response regulator [Microcoleus sp.]